MTKLATQLTFDIEPTSWRRCVYALSELVAVSHFGFPPPAPLLKCVDPIDVDVTRAVYLICSYSRYGPPTNNGDDIKDVTINADESCDDGSEHTWVRSSCVSMHAFHVAKTYTAYP